MDKNNVFELTSAVYSTDPLTEILRTGARHLIQVEVQSEFQEFLAQYQDRRLDTGRSEGGVSNQARATLLDAQDRQCTQCAAQSQPTEGHASFA